MAAAREATTPQTKPKRESTAKPFDVPTNIVPPDPAEIAAAQALNPRPKHANGRTYENLTEDICNSVGIKAICDAIVNGASYGTIAKHLRIQKSHLQEWIGADADRIARVSAARRLSASHWDEVAETLVKDATNLFELAKARELAHHYRWRASKVSPFEYGTKVEVVGSVNTGERAVLIEQIASAMETTRDAAMKVLPAPDSEAPAETDDPAGARDDSE